MTFVQRLVWSKRSHILLYALVAWTALILPGLWLLRMGDAREALHLLRSSKQSLPVSTTTTIYIASETLIASEPITGILDTVSQLSPKQVFVLDEDIRPGIRSRSNSGMADLSFVRATEAKYYLRVVTDGPFILVFLTTFNADWKLYVKPESNAFEGFFPETWYLEPLSEQCHFRVNGYGNGWFVDIGTGEYEMVMEYRPQNLYYLTFYFATAAKLEGLALLLVHWIGALCRKIPRPGEQ